MPLIRPSLMLVMDLDERNASDDIITEIRRNYSYITTPVIHTHTCENEDDPVRNTMQMMVRMGTYKYLHSDDEDADKNWDEIVEPWLRNILHKVGSTMRAYNKHQYKIDLPDIVFDRVEVELEGGSFVVALHPHADSWIDRELHAQIGQARAFLNDGTFKDAVRVDIPSEKSYAEQYEREKTAWDEEHPEPEEPEEEPESESAPEPEPEKTYEELMAEDIEAKSYENTAVAPTDSETLPPIDYEEEPEREVFDFDVDYSIWTVTYEDGSTRTYNSAESRFEDET